MEWSMKMQKILCSVNHKHQVMQFVWWIVACLAVASTTHGVSDDLEELTVHVVPHTHDDVGWLKTVDQYFIGSRQDIQAARVQYIIDSVIDSLEKNPDRKFIYVEMAFFYRWWTQQNDDRKEVVRRMVRNGQLEFINAGWCMNDEAATYYQSIVDQMTEGHLFLLKEFGFIPRVGWHIDPFGHSSTQASLFSSMGFDSFMFGRIDYQDRDLRIKEKNLEVLWRGSASQGASNDMFSANLYWGYGPPPGFCFDVHCGDDPIQARADLFDYDLDKRADLFAKYAREQAAAIKGDIMFTFGSDFLYEQAEEWFSNIDILIKYFKENYSKYKLVVKYSTPAIYTDAKFNANTTWNLKTDDFFPYADGPHAYWTGYFVSRAAYKAYERYSNAYYQVCKQLETFRDLNLKQSPSGSSSKLMADSMGIAQHHDSVSGTAKQHVNDDYTKRLAMGCAECDIVASEALSVMFTGKTGTEFTRCEYLNVSICSPSESFADKLSVVLYNSLGQTRTEVIRIPVSSPDVMVVDASGKTITFQIQPLPSDVSRARYHVDIPTTATHEVVFEAEVASLSTLTLTLVKIKAASSSLVSLAQDTSIENGFLKLTFNPDTGMLGSLTNKKTGKTISLTQSWQWYRSSAGTPDDGQASGAYIFRPVDSNTTSLGGKATITVVKGKVSDEVHQVVSNIVSQVVRLYHSKPYVEFEYTLGPIDVTDGIGKEVVTRFSSDLDSGKTFFTDANGREVLERTLNYRKDWPLQVHEPASGNYYPVNTRIMIQDAKQDLQLTIVTDRSQGGSSLLPGEVELMVNRRITHDDGRGVGEPLNEDIVVRGKYWIFLDSITASTELHRLYAERLQNPLATFFTEAALPSRTQNLKMLAKTDLPENVHLMSVQKLDDEGFILLRLAHLFAEGESSTLAVPVTVDLSTLGVELVQELSLSANQPLDKVNRLPWNGVSRNPSSSLLGGGKVKISPMEIRTYVVKLL
jgi:hypothetical protein